jgi:signal transduction histidine kinase/DNA-binding response OmpR family regulator/HPt (histidine-containing phosphotransfer) domain-containing protein
MTIRSDSYMTQRKRRPAVSTSQRAKARVRARVRTTNARRDPDVETRLRRAKKELLAALHAQRGMTRDLARLKEEADAANRAKSAFLANMSHEIRTPLNAILGMAELLEASELSRSQRQHVAVLRTAGDALIRLIGDVLDLAKVEAARLELESAPFDVHALFESTAEVVALGAHRKGLYLTLDVDPDVPRWLVGDEHRLRQVLLNLLGNAIKFTERGGIAIAVAFETMVDGKARFRASIRDTGIGIPHEQAGNLFQPFTQVDATASRVHGGSGLGLSLCDRLLHLMGGRIWFESEPGRGSTFHFAVALPVDARAASGSLEWAAHLGSGRRALVVDDHDEERAALRRQLERFGFTVSEAGGGGAGIAEIVQALRDRVAFDVLLIDARMPTIDGLGVVEAIRELQGTAARTILLLQADHREDDIARATGLGVVQWVVKPPAASKLLLALESIVQGVHAPIDAAKPEPAPVPARLTGSILLADDSEDNRYVVLEFLKETQLKVECAENGEVAVAKASSGNFDLILMDMQMPVMDGFAAARAMRSLEAVRGGRRIPILAFSADVLPSDRDRSLAAGCDGHLSKPVSRRSLLEALERHLAVQPEASPPAVPQAAAAAPAAAAPAPAAPAAPVAAAPVPAAPAPQNPPPPAATTTLLRTAEADSTSIAAALSDEGPEVGIEALAEGYLARRTEDVTSLRALLERGDFSTIERRGHNVKGSGVTYGFPELSRIGERIEAAAKAESRAGVELAIGELEAGVHALHEARASLPILPTRNA